MRRAGLDGYADMGASEIGAAVGNRASLGSEFIKPFAGENDEVGGLAAAQPRQQADGRRELRINANAGRGLELWGKPHERALQCKRREQPDRIIRHGDPLSKASERAHQLQHRLEPQAAPANQGRGLPGRTPGIACAGKADADLMAAEDRIVALGWRVLLVEDLAFPAAALGGVGAEIIEERVAAEDAAVIEQHHAGQAALHTIKRANVDGIESIADGALADPTRDRQWLVLDRRHDRLKG